MAHYGHSMGRGVSPSDREANDTMAHRMALDAAIARVRALKARRDLQRCPNTGRNHLAEARAHLARLRGKSEAD